MNVDSRVFVCSSGKEGGFSCNDFEKIRDDPFQSNYSVLKVYLVFGAYK